MHDKFTIESYYQRSIRLCKFLIPSIPFTHIIPLFLFFGLFSIFFSTEKKKSYSKREWANINFFLSYYLSQINLAVQKDSNNRNSDLR